MVSKSLSRNSKGSGYFTSALLVLASTMLGLSYPIYAQTSPIAPPPISAEPVPGELELNKLVWSTMAAVDHANQAGNYSVLRDLAAPGFQANNDAARLAEIFANLRASRIDLSNTLLLAPNFGAAPKIVSPGILYLKGYFGLRPTAITFELYYQWVNGKWKLFGVAIAPASISGNQPKPVTAPPPKK